jgi:HK97 gp10 family phage protein
MITINMGAEWPALERQLSRIAASDAINAMRVGTRAGAKVIQPMAVQLAPKRTGALKAAIKVQAPKRRIASNAISTLVRAGKGDFVGKTFYAAFQEYGWKVGARKLGDARRQVEGQHYMERAAKQMGERAIQVAIEATWAALAKLAQRK